MDSDTTRQLTEKTATNKLSPREAPVLVVDLSKLDGRDRALLVSGLTYRTDGRKLPSVARDDNITIALHCTWPIREVLYFRTHLLRIPISASIARLGTPYFTTKE